MNNICSQEIKKNVRRNSSKLFRRSKLLRFKLLKLNTSLFRKMPQISELIPFSRPTALHGFLFWDMDNASVLASIRGIILASLEIAWYFQAIWPF